MKEETIDRYQQETPAANLMNKELKKTLEDAIHDLPEKYRTVFILRELEDMSIAETKDCLAITEVNVKVRLNRAKSMLRNSLAELYRSGNIFEFHLSRCDRMVAQVMAQLHA